jgi:hemerythrin
MQTNNNGHVEASGGQVIKNEQLSIVEALRQAHVALHRELAGLEQAARSPSGTDSADMRSLLERTRADILEHFRFEELNGYMNAVLDREPNLARTVENLREEHRQIAQELDSLIERTKTERALDDVFRDRVRLWIESVRRHETDENTLVQDAFNVDFAAED